MFALIEFGGDSGGAFVKAFVKLGFEVGEFGFDFAAFFDVGAEFEAELLDECFGRNTRCSFRRRQGDCFVCGCEETTPTELGWARRVRPSSLADSTLPEDCGAEDHTGQAEASGARGKHDFFGPGVGAIHECLGTATRAGRAICVGAAAGEFVADGGGSDGGVEFAGFSTEGARAGEVRPEADGGGQHDGNYRHGEESLHGAVASWLLSVFTTRSIFPIRSGGQIVQSLARTSVPCVIGIGGAGGWVKWLMRGAIGKNQ